MRASGPCDSHLACKSSVSSKVLLLSFFLQKKKWGEERKDRESGSWAPFLCHLKVHRASVYPFHMMHYPS